MLGLRNIRDTISKSSKNRLQEFCQKRSISFPLYDTSKTHEHTIENNRFTSTCTVVVDGEMIVTHGFGTKKIGAEVHAAQEMLDKLTKIEQS